MLAAWWMQHHVYIICTWFQKVYETQQGNKETQQVSIRVGIIPVTLGFIWVIGSEEVKYGTFYRMAVWTEQTGCSQKQEAALLPWRRLKTNDSSERSIAVHAFYGVEYDCLVCASKSRVQKSVCWLLCTSMSLNLISFHHIVPSKHQALLLTWLPLYV